MVIPALGQPKKHRIVYSHARRMTFCASSIVSTNAAFSRAYFVAIHAVQRRASRRPADPVHLQQTNEGCADFGLRSVNERCARARCSRPYQRDPMPCGGVAMSRACPSRFPRTILSTMYWRSTDSLSCGRMRHSQWLATGHGRQRQRRLDEHRLAMILSNKSA